MNSIPLRGRRPSSTGSRTASKRASRSRGQAIVELALILPIMLIMLGAAIDLGRLFYSQISVNDAAREAALEASRNPSSFIPNTACTSANKEQNRVMCRALNEAKGSFVTVAATDVTMECSTYAVPADVQRPRRYGLGPGFRSFHVADAAPLELFRRSGDLVRLDSLGAAPGDAEPRVGGAKRELHRDPHVRHRTLGGDVRRYLDRRADHMVVGLR